MFTFAVTRTGKYIYQLVTRYVWPTILAGEYKIVENCKRGTPGAVFGVPLK